MKAPMTFAQARRRLAKIARGEYHALQYEITTSARKHGGHVAEDCGVYIHGWDWYHAPTWEGAFSMLLARGDRRRPPRADRRRQP